MAGPEPFMEALEGGAQVVVAGRSSDTSIFACVPLLMGLPPGPVWHAAKILECGAGAVSKRLHPDCLLARVSEDGFEVEPPNPTFACTPLSVASHNLYEASSPFELHEPSGTLDLTNCRYESVDTRRVKVTGSAFHETSRYSIKLEGVRLAGYSCYFIGGIRDPFLLRQLESWQSNLEAALHRRFQELHGPHVAQKYQLVIRRYGVDGVMGQQEPDPRVSNEIGLMLEVIADSQDLAFGLTKTAAHFALHYPIDEWTGLISTLAFPHSPPEVNRGPVYEFTIDHAVEPNDPMEMFTINYIDVGNNASIKRQP